MCQNLLLLEGVRNLKCQTRMCQNWIVSEFFKLVGVRIFWSLKVWIWRCQNLKVSEPVDDRIFKNWKVSESENLWTFECVRTWKCQNFLELESVRNNQSLIASEFDRTGSWNRIVSELVRLIQYLMSVRAKMLHPVCIFQLKKCAHKTWRNFRSL